MENFLSVDKNHLVFQLYLILESFEMAKDSPFLTLSSMLVPLSASIFEVIQCH